MNNALVVNEAVKGSVALPGPEDIKILQQQYKKAVDGLYEAYLFGVMLMKVKVTLEGLKKEQSTGVLTRENARTNGGELAVGGWNAGTGLKGWLAEFVPEIHYKTAMRFMDVAASTHSGMRVDLSHAPEEAAVRDWLSGKSQREVLRLGGKREGAGRKPKDYAAALGTDPAVAWKEIEGPLQALSEMIVVHRRHQVLTEVDRQTLKDTLDLMLQNME